MKSRIQVIDVKCHSYTVNRFEKSYNTVTVNRCKKSYTGNYYKIVL